MQTSRGFVVVAALCAAFPPPPRPVPAPPGPRPGRLGSALLRGAPGPRADGGGQSHLRGRQGRRARPDQRRRRRAHHRRHRHRHPRRRGQAGAPRDEGEARRLLEALRIEMSAAGSRVEVRTQFPRGTNQSSVAVDYTITVPADATVTARTDLRRRGRRAHRRRGAAGDGQRRSRRVGRHQPGAGQDDQRRRDRPRRDRHHPAVARHDQRQRLATNVKGGRSRPAASAGRCASATSTWSGCRPSRCPANRIHRPAHPRRPLPVQRPLRRHPRRHPRRHRLRADRRHLQRPRPDRLRDDPACRRRRPGGRAQRARDLGDGGAFLEVHSFSGNLAITKLAATGRK